MYFRGLGIVLTTACACTLVLSGCGAPKALMAAPAGLTDGGVAVRGLDLAKMIARSLEGAKGGNIQGARRASTVFYALARGLKLEKTTDLADLVAIGRAQRALVHLIAEQEGAWFPYATMSMVEGRHSLDLGARTIRVWGRTVDFDLEFDDVMILVNDALEATLDNFPTPPPEAAAGFGAKGPADYYVYKVAAHVLITEAGRVARTESDVAALREALTKTTDKATKTPDMPKDMIAMLAGWEGEFRGLKPNRPAGSP